jgi:hypothetical protein
MSDPTREQDPKNFVFQFFRTLMMSQCHVSFSMLTPTSQKAFIDWVQKDMYRRKPEASKAANIGPNEVRLLIEQNDTTVMKTFWRYFYQKSGCYDLIYNGIYSNQNESPNSAEVFIQLPADKSGNKRQVVFKIVKKGPVWKLCYVESGAPL